MYIDARGLECPHPVIQAKKALQGALDPITVAVDNAIAVQNLEKMSAELGHSSDTRKIAENHYEVMIVPEGKKAENSPIFANRPRSTRPAQMQKKNTVVFVKSQHMGIGEEKLGAALMKSFFFALTELDEMPASIIFLNGGVFLTAQDSAIIDDLTILDGKGVRIFTCGACINYYALPEKPAVGTVSNMYDIAHMLQHADHIITP